jgi:hypothetical protein
MFPTVFRTGMCFSKTFSLFTHQGPIFCYLYCHSHILLSHPHASFCHVAFFSHTCPFCHVAFFCHMRPFATSRYSVTHAFFCRARILLLPHRLLLHMRSLAMFRILLPHTCMLHCIPVSPSMHYTKHLQLPMCTYYRTPFIRFLKFWGVQDFPCRIIGPQLHTLFPSQPSTLFIPDASVYPDRHIFRLAHFLIWGCLSLRLSRHRASPDSL